jgi:histidine phosphotransferase ChpT
MEKLRLLHLLCSRICHDLITPVSAINNGFELLGEDLSRLDKETSALIQQSAQSAAQRLMMFRAGYSYGGQYLLSTFEKTEQLLNMHLGFHKIYFNWSTIDDDKVLIGTQQSQWGRILVNLVNIFTEVALDGGELTLSFINQEEYVSAKIALRGDLSELRQEVVLALEGSLAEQDVTVQSIQSYLTFLLMDTVPIKTKFIENSTNCILVDLQNYRGALQNSGTLF